MRTNLVTGLAAMAAVVAVACSTNPKPQQPVTNPEPQAAGIGIQHGPGKPMNDPSVQQPALETPSSQQAINQPEPQKPFYGPGLTAPEDRADEQAKAKQPVASDGDALAVLMAVNDGEVQMGEMAKKNAESADVKQFAAMMSTHHQQAMGKMRNLQSKSKIELKENDLSTKVKNDAGQEMATLRDKKGKEFDRLYIDSQVRLHKEALDAIDNRVLPGVTNGEVKTSINEARRQISDHLAKAESLLKKLDPTTAAARSDDKGTTGNKTDTSSTSKGKTDLDDKAEHKAHETKKDVKKGASDVKKDVKEDTNK